MFSRDRGDTSNAALVFDKQARIQAADHPYCGRKGCLLRTAGRSHLHCPIHEGEPDSG